MKTRKYGTSIGGILTSTLLLSFSAEAAPNSLTYQGRILKNDGTPLEYSNVSFQFEITSPNGQCIIYREQVDHIDLTNSGGVFDVPIGTGSQSHPDGKLFPRTTRSAPSLTRLTLCQHKSWVHISPQISF